VLVFAIEKLSYFGSYTEVTLALGLLPSASNKQTQTWPQCLFYSGLLRKKTENR